MASIPTAHSQGSFNIDITDKIDNVNIADTTPPTTMTAASSEKPVIQPAGNDHSERDLANGGKEMRRADTSGTATSQALPFKSHTTLSAKVVEALHSDPKIGLTDSDATKRFDVYGPNRLKPPKRPSPLKIIARQFGNAMSLVLSEWSPLDQS